MRCPACFIDNDRVMDSRSNNEGDFIRRRRECLQCGHRFTSYEKIEQKPFKVVKKNNKREHFDSEKLRKGLELALRKRPISADDIDDIIDWVTTEAAELGRAKAGRAKGEIASTQLGELVLKKLYEVDRVAYVRFASVYRNFDNIEEFVAIIKEMNN
ncbi:MAG: transcriptional regulator NrdR [Spirochaetaceae bacterium]|nr:transcriptional regulator NrdR [Spirochaetaceae bacterium]